MAYRFPFVSLLCAAAFFTASCESTGPGGDAMTAQQLVEDVARRHPDVARLTVHATPSGSSRLQAVASTSAEKRNKPSDPEDVRALEHGQEIVLLEGDNLDVTLPMTDDSGRRKWVAGITVRPDGRSREQTLAAARAIAGELDAAIRAAQQPLW